MSNIENLNVAQLHKIIAIKEQIETLQSQFDSITGEGPQAGNEIPVPFGVESGKKRRKMSAAAKAKIAAAARARWAKVRGEAGSNVEPVKKKKRRMTAAGKAAIKAALKARWAKYRAEKSQ